MAFKRLSPDLSVSGSMDTLTVRRSSAKARTESSSVRSTCCMSSRPNLRPTLSPTLRYPNVYALGDAAGSSNAKTAATARKQAPVVAVNVFATLEGREPVADYDGYGSCPLNVEHGKIVLAEFGYGGKLLSCFPSWMLDGTKRSRAAWSLKERMLPPICWQAILKGREWMAAPHKIGALA